MIHTSLRWIGICLSLLLSLFLAQGCKKAGFEGIYIQNYDSRLAMMQETIVKQRGSREGFLKSVTDAPKILGYRLTLSKGGQALLEMTRFGGTEGPQPIREGKGSWSHKGPQLSVTTTGQEAHTLLCRLEQEIVRCKTDALKTELLFVRY